MDPIRQGPTCSIALEANSGQPDPRLTTDALHQDAARYDALANYHRNFVVQGITTPGDIVSRTTLPRDDLGAARDRLDAYRASGLDTVCIYPLAFDVEDRRALEELTR